MHKRNFSCDDATAAPSAALQTVEDIVRFVMAGDATVTLKSERTDTAYTFRISTPKEDVRGRRFVALLTGPDNESDFTYIGLLELGRLRLTAKSKMTDDSPPVKAFRYMLLHVFGHRKMAPELAVYHEGRCGRCNRKLTTVESIERGIGPECAAKMGLL